MRGEEHPPTLLDGVRVVDLTQLLAGPYATQILADMGAEVIKVEPPSGDKARGNGPLVDGQSTYFASINRGKKSVILDLKTPGGRRVIYDLVRQSQLVVENFQPGVAQRLGIDFETLKTVNPTVIYAACSGFGQTGRNGSLPALDIVIQALAGTMSITGYPGGEPVRVGFSVGDIGAGLYLAIAMLGALYRHRNEPRAMFVDLSMLDSQVAMLENAFARYFATGVVPQPTGSRHPVIAPFQCFQASDRPFVVAASTPTQWKELTRVVGREEWQEDPRFSSREARIQHVEELSKELGAIFKTRTAREWVSELEKARVPAAMVNTVEQAAQDPRLEARHMFTDVHYGPSQLTVVGSPVRIDGQQVMASRQVPTLGEHQSYVLSTVLGYTAEEVRALAMEGVFGWTTEQSV
jgi:CoA:oxalate CoA-transferase